MSTGSKQRVTRSTYWDRDVLAYYEERGKRMDRTVDWQMREILRAAMQAEQPTTSQDRRTGGGR